MEESEKLKKKLIMYSVLSVAFFIRYFIKNGDMLAIIHWLLILKTTIIAYKYRKTGDGQSAKTGTRGDG